MSTYTASRRSFFRLTPVTAVLLLLAVALVTWTVTVLRMRGMDAGPGTDLGGLGWYIDVWVTMMAAMMFPSAAPMVLLFRRVSSERERRGQSFVPTRVIWTGLVAQAHGTDHQRTALIPIDAATKCVQTRDSLCGGGSR